MAYILNQTIICTFFVHCCSFVIQGGYSHKSTSEGIAMCTKALLGDPCPPLDVMEQPLDR